MKSKLLPQQILPIANYRSAMHTDRAVGLCEFESAFRVIHDSYAQHGFILPNRASIWLNEHHLLASSRVFLAMQTKQVCGTLTLVEDGPLGVPMESLFGQEVQQCRETNGSIAEATCLARSLPGSTEGSKSEGPKIVNQLMGAVAQTARRSGIKQILITVHPRHAQYYIRLAGFRSLGPPRAYPAVRGHLALPLALHLPSLSQVCPAAHRRYFGMQFSETTLATHPTSPATLQSLAMIWNRLQRENLPEKFPGIATNIRSVA